ncbi:cytochrome o ubiquinol oxidase subunit I [Shewanella surugensis]|uniref:Cytochrome bo(3) ubiquinol oxidase subunit 1 n=1 Tax=Shewanella surugensis TaxID=212020 RepID=A0ABT0L9U9_9GAMM|nr:cytochrome o ubiquinol oxidase subunit I [Shewanella surugensis]MCL1124438.1 cytochrome o ubiquinol oxidase subunit I [Shewanella surugensis]
MFGKLTWDSIPWDNPLPMGAVAMMVAVVVIIGVLITRAGKWSYLWHEWITSVDHKKIGIMYMLVAFVMMLRGFSDAIMMRLQLAIASGNEGYLPPEHYDQIFTAHGVIMIFFVAMPLVIGLINIVVPQQIGARDVAFPFLNSLSFWLFFVGMALVNISLGVGEFAKTGWLAYPPLSELGTSPGVGVDYYIWSLQIAGVGTLMTGINFFVTIMKMRCPGMTLMRMPIFTWTALFTNILIIAAFPVLTVTLALLALDRYIGTHFFTATAGGDQMMYVNLIWIWGHPEVYILILPAFGVFSEVVSTFSRKKLFGYTSMVYASAVIAILAFSVWLHHFFTMGSGANVNAFFGIATMIISIPTGVKIFNWLFTIFRGRLKINLPIMWTLAFLSTFTIGGMTGVLLSVPGADFLLHNSLFLIAHFHNVIIGGVVFGMFAGYSYWFPKAMGYTLDEKWGKRAFWLWVSGFYLAFIPLYALGFMGMTRRLSHYDPSTGWQPLLLVALSGAVLILFGVLCQVTQLYVSIRDRHINQDVTGDPWDGRTLEWATSSPPANYNFPFTPVVEDRDCFWSEKEKNNGQRPKETREYVDIHMPRNTGAGVIISAFSLVFGFAMIWHIWWLAGLGLLGMFVSFIRRCFETDVDYYIPAAEVEATEKLRVHNV